MTVIFCGVPPSGKTTIAKNLVSRLRKAGTARIFISDSLRPPVYKKFFRLIEENRGKYDFLVFDAAFYRKEWRRRMRKLSGEEKMIVACIKCSLATALERNKTRRPKIPERAVRIVYRRFEKPKADVVVDSEKTDAAEATKSVAGFILPAACSSRQRRARRACP